MKEIPIARDETIVDEESAKDYVAVLNGIIDECYNHDGFREGTRNEIAVNLTVAAYCLGLEPIRVLDQLIGMKVIDPSDDDEDTWDRVRVIIDYADRFSWDWMLNPLYYCKPIYDDIPIRYKLS